MHGPHQLLQPRIDQLEGALIERITEMVLATCEELRKRSVPLWLYPGLKREEVQAGLGSEEGKRFFLKHLRRIALHTDDEALEVFEVKEAKKYRG